MITFSQFQMGQQCQKPLFSMALMEKEQVLKVQHGHGRKATSAVVDEEGHP